MMQSMHHFHTGFDELDETMFFEEELLDDVGDYEETFLDEELDLEELQTNGLMNGTIGELAPSLAAFEGMGEFGTFGQVDLDTHVDVDAAAINLQHEHDRATDHTLSYGDQVLLDMGLVPQTSFTFIGSMECFIERHDRFCEAYQPHTMQMFNGPVPGICCYTLSSNTTLCLEIERDDDGKIKIFITNAYTTGLMGVVPEAFSEVLLPLICHGLVSASGRIETLIHPETSCPPPFKLILSADLDVIQNNSFHPDIAKALSQLRRWLKRPRGNWIQPELPSDISVIRKILNKVEKKRVRHFVPVPIPEVEKPRKEIRRNTTAAPVRELNKSVLMSQSDHPSKAAPREAPSKRSSGDKINPLAFLTQRRMIRNRKEIEECAAGDVPNLISAIQKESDKQIPIIASIISGSDRTFRLRQLVDTIVSDFVECQDPLSCIGRLWGATSSLQSSGGIHDLVSLTPVLNAIRDGWRVVMSETVGPRLSLPLAQALQKLIVNASSNLGSAV